MRRGIVVALMAVLLGAAAPRAQDGTADGARRRNLDQLLDLYVRDGFVYYRALKSDRRLLDGYVNALGGASVASAPRAEQIAFWLNAYNALVLRTVHHRVRGARAERGSQFFVHQRSGSRHRGSCRSLARDR